MGKRGLIYKREIKKQIKKHSDLTGIGGKVKQE